MSKTIDVESDILSKIATATGGATHPEPVKEEQAGEYPFAFPLNPAWTGEAIEWGQVENTRSHPFLILWKKSETSRDTWIGHVEAIALAVRLDTTLGGLVDRAWVSELSTEEVDDEEVVSALLIVSATHVEGDS